MEAMVHPRAGTAKRFFLCKGFRPPGMAMPGHSHFLIETRGRNGERVVQFTIFALFLRLCVRMNVRPRYQFSFFSIPSSALRMAVRSSSNVD